MITTNISKGSLLSLTYHIKNTGNATAPMTHTKLYISTTPTLTNALLLSELSCESLIAAQETQEVNFIYPLPYNCSAGTNYILISADSRNEVIETDENNTIVLGQTVTVSASTGGRQNLPYPVIFVHGLHSDKTTWTSLINDLQNWYGWSYGGNMNFCLNQDNNIHTSNLSNDYKDWTVTSSLTAADLYTINFDVDINGLDATVFTRIESNESAIKKQGLAVRDAIKHVLLVTGRNKVILAGHSMGGLALREYIQNPSNWQPADGLHHVAKLLTIGTPHGGSNTGLGILNPLIDEYSEAVRDLRTTYYVSGDSGVYLFGGPETYQAMNDSYFFNFNNVDVNCNGIDNDGTMITGLNHKPITADIDYSCIIGKYGGAANDGIVSASSANLNTYYNSIADTFVVDAFHTNETTQSAVIVKGIHEPSNPLRSYEIQYNNLYFGNFTKPNTNSSSIVDSNYFKFSVVQNGTTAIELFNIPLPGADIRIINPSNSLQYSFSSNGKAYLNSGQLSLNPGNYYLNISGLPELEDWKHPYAFKLGFSALLPLKMLEFTAVKKDGAALLQWKTFNEFNSGRYIIERNNGNNDWIIIGILNNGTGSAGSNQYSYTDLNPLRGLNYYRVKMTDLNGIYIYSDIRAVEFESVDDPFVISPNPANSFTNIRFFKPVSSVGIFVYDSQGRLVIKEFNKGLINSWSLETGKLSAGVYLVRLEIPGGVYTNKLIVYR